KALSAGPMYLCGFDMVHGHCSGYAHNEIPSGTDATCVDGAVRKTNALYLRTQSELSQVFDDWPVIQCSPTGLPILSQWASAGTLPNPQSLRAFTLDPTVLESRHQGRVEHLERRMRS